MVAHASAASSKPIVELDSHADMCVVGDNCFIIHDHNRPVNVYTKDCHRSVKTDHAAVGWVSKSIKWTEVYLNDKPSYLQS